MNSEYCGLWTLQQAADFFKVSTRTVLNWRKRYGLTCCKIPGGTVRFEPVVCESFMKSYAQRHGGDVNNGQHQQ